MYVLVLPFNIAAMVDLYLLLTTMSCMMFERGGISIYAVRFEFVIRPDLLLVTEDGKHAGMLKADYGVAISLSVHSFLQWGHSLRSSTVNICGWTDLYTSNLFWTT